MNKNKDYRYSFIGLSLILMSLGLGKLQSLDVNITMLKGFLLGCGFTIVFWGTLFPEWFDSLLNKIASVCVEGKELEK